MKYIIDGYNLVHQLEELKGKRLRSQREGLIRLLEIAQAQNRQLKDVTLVFDGQKDVVAPQPSSKIKVIFSSTTCADKKIKQMVELSHFARDIAVVSNDRQVRFYAGSLGAKKVTVEEFLNVVFSSQAEQKNCTFKLNQQQAKKINQELEEIWLKK